MKSGRNGITGHAGFSQDERTSMAHALAHLEANKIADENYAGYGGWYRGDREQFVKRHRKAIALLRSILRAGGFIQGMDYERSKRDAQG